ncbi:hypothetical protein DF024_24465 [Burkholderia cenocepacia]|nr:hypothetical protein DF024_24465 [Burkholderia cenocepacia]
MQLAIFAISNRIGPISHHSENSRDHFRDKYAKFFLVYVCAAGFVAFSIRRFTAVIYGRIAPVRTAGSPRTAPRGGPSQLVYDDRHRCLTRFPR